MLIKLVNFTVLNKIQCLSVYVIIHIKFVQKRKCTKTNREVGLNFDLYLDISSNV